eukprot:312438-Chlamydomonas_euryale.AAC.2
MSHACQPCSQVGSGARRSARPKYWPADRVSRHPTRQCSTERPAECPSVHPSVGGHLQVWVATHEAIFILSPAATTKYPVLSLSG